MGTSAVLYTDHTGGSVCCSICIWRAASWVRGSLVNVSFVYHRCFARSGEVYRHWHPLTGGECYSPPQNHSHSVLLLKLPTQLWWICLVNSVSQLCDVSRLDVEAFLCFRWMLLQTLLIQFSLSPYSSSALLWLYTLTIKHSGVNCICYQSLLSFPLSFSSKSLLTISSVNH